jgi:GT2 family glycosyltransferase
MISLIICSRTPALSQKLANNIAETIGVPYEIVLLDNSANTYGICQAYNIGVQQSKYDVLCFMHDDIFYHSKNWGLNVLNHFKTPEVSAIGIVGSPYCTFMPGPWWGSGLIYEHILQANNPETTPALKSNAGSANQRQVVVVDGSWFCIEKAAFNKVEFDEKNFPGYHFYDADISMQLYTAGYKTYAIADVLIYHASMGNINNDWINSAFAFQKKWANNLPANCLAQNNKPVFAYEYKTLNGFIWSCHAVGYSNKRIYAFALKYLLQFKQGYAYAKTPGYLIKFIFKYLFKKGHPFYSFL